MVPEGGVFREKFARGFLETGAWFHHQNKRRFGSVLDCLVFLCFFRIFVAVDVGFSLEMFGASSHPMFTKHVTRIYAAAGYDLSLKIFVRHWLWNFDLWNFDSHSDMKITVNRGLVGGDLFYLIPSTKLRLEHIGKHHSPPINISKPTSPKN